MSRPFQDDGRRWLTITQAAYLYGCCINTMRTMADRGLVSVKRTPGKHRRIDRDSLEGPGLIDRDRQVALDILKGLGTR